MTRHKDEQGNTYGRLTVIGLGVPPDGNTSAWWDCRCSCPAATVITVRGSDLRRGGSRSCGCIAAEQLSAMAHRHGDSGGRTKRHYLYVAWNGIKNRTGNPKNPGYPHYGGRGIRMHEPWRADFVAFRDWILANLGERPSDEHTIDRVQNNGNYEPDNLRWATRQEQSDNKRTSLARVQQIEREYDDLAAWVKGWIA